MTQAYNLSQLANNLNTTGQLDATDGLVNAVPIVNGGTGASDQATAQSNLDVPSRTGSGASGSWAINAATSTSTPKFLSTNFTIEESSGKLLFKYGATTIASMSSAGVITSISNITAGGTP
jgi:hypothetical protein